jgi:uncharacterized membrane protein YhaH (DUF805 family)
MRSLIEFIFPRRLHRVAYFLRLLASNVGFGLILATSSPLEQLVPFLGFATLAIYQVLFIGLPRLRDTGMSGWWILSAFVPVAYIFLSIILLFRAPEYHFERSSSRGAEPT